MLSCPAISNKDLNNAFLSLLVPISALKVTFQKVCPFLMRAKTSERIFMTPITLYNMLHIILLHITQIKCDYLFVNVQKSETSWECLRFSVFTIH